MSTLTDGDHDRRDTVQKQAEAGYSGQGNLGRGIQSKASAGDPRPEGDTTLPTLHESPNPEGAVCATRPRDSSPPSPGWGGIQMAEGGDRVSAGGQRGVPGPPSL